MFNNNVLIRLLGKCYYSKSIVNIDLWIEKYSNWIVVAVFLLFSTSVLLRMAALFFHDRWKPVHKDSEWSPSQTLSMHHTLHLSSVMSSLCTERAAGKCSWPHTLHLNTVSRSPRTRMQGPLQIQRTIRLTVRSVNDNSQRGSLQTAVWALHSLMT